MLDRDVLNSPRRSNWCMTVEIPADLAPFVQRLIAERRFLTEGDVVAEGWRLLQSQAARAVVPARHRGVQRTCQSSRR
jgi:Arc/MetJ-type ribon-helix-helix transcriptional regulator